MTLLDRLGFPSLGRHRRFVGAIAIDAIGTGVFMPVSILYFLVTTDLTLVQVGGAVSLASVVSLPTGPLLGGLVDRYGAKRILLAGNVLQAVGFVGYLVSGSFLAVTLWTVVVTLGRTAFWGSYGNIVTAISAPGEREKWFGFLGALRNVGFALGGLLAGLAISIGSPTAFHAVVVANVASYVVAFALLLAVPPPARAAHQAAAGGWAVVLRDRPYRMLWVSQLAFSTAMMVLNFAIPVYATATLGLPGWVTGAVYTINTVMVGFGQGMVVRRMNGRLRWRLLVTAHGAFVASYLVLLSASRLPVVLGTAVVLGGAMVYTLGELIGGPVHGALAAEAALEHLRGRYLAMIQLAWQIASTVAPVTFAWLLDRGSAETWLALTAIAVVGAVLAGRLQAVLPQAAEPVRGRADGPLTA